MGWVPQCVGPSSLGFQRLTSVKFCWSQKVTSFRGPLAEAQSPALAPPGLGCFLWSCCQGNPGWLDGSVVILPLASLSSPLSKTTNERWRSKWPTCQCPKTMLTWIKKCPGSSGPQTERIIFSKHSESRSCLSHSQLRPTSSLPRCLEQSRCSVNVEWRN